MLLIIVDIRSEGRGQNDILCVKENQSHSFCCSVRWSISNIFDWLEWLAWSIFVINIKPWESNQYVVVLIPGRTETSSRWSHDVPEEPSAEHQGSTSEHFTLSTSVIGTQIYDRRIGPGLLLPPPHLHNVPHWSWWRGNLKNIGFLSNCKHEPVVCKSLRSRWKCNCKNRRAPHPDVLLIYFCVTNIMQYKSTDQRISRKLSTNIQRAEFHPHHSSLGHISLL